MPPAFLAVLSEPGSLVTLSEFHDWYDSEHIPLRLNHLPSFLTGARFSATDGQSPSWLALYDIDDTSTFQHEGYTRLRLNRSEREASLVKRLEVLDRRTCEVVWDSGESPKTTSLRAKNPTLFVVTHGLEAATTEDAINWAEEVAQKLRAAEAWIRTRVFKYLDTFKAGVGIPPGAEGQQVAPYLVLHEFVSLEPSTPLREIDLVDGKVSELRKWALYRAYLSLTQRE